MKIAETRNFANMQALLGDKFWGNCDAIKNGHISRKEVFDMPVNHEDYSVG